MGLNKSLREPAFSELQRPLPGLPHILMNAGGSSNGTRNTGNNRNDAVAGRYNTGSTNNYRYTFSARVSAASGSEVYTGSSQHSYPHRWTRAPPSNRSNTDEHRHWIYNTIPPPSSTGRFVIVSYNILGVDNASEHLRELYWHIPSFIMEWKYRKRRILLELRLWSPDIICLQEVDRFEDLQSDFVQQGYEGVYKGRTGGSSDGCAVFWRTKKFALVQEESIEFQEHNLRHNVAQLCVLRMKTEDTRGKGKRSKGMVADNLVVVCNIHVLFNPNRGDIKLGQVRHLLEKAHSLSHEWGGVPVVVAGDFNSVPQSPLYRLLHNGVLDVRNYDRRAISGQVERSRGVRQTRVERWTSSQIQIEKGGQIRHTEASIASTECSITENNCVQPFHWTAEELEMATGFGSESVMKHSLNLQSAYSSIEGSQETRDTSNEPLVTTYHGNFMGTVDYIWFTEGLLPVRVLEVLPAHILQRTKGLPSKKWGSDHLALACEFSFTM